MQSEAHDALGAAFMAALPAVLEGGGGWSLALDAVLSARLAARCERCNGRKVVERYNQPAWSGGVQVSDTMHVSMTCEACHGTGTVPGPLALIAVLVERGVLEQVKLDDLDWRGYLRIADPMEWADAVRAALPPPDAKEQW